MSDDAPAPDPARATRPASSPPPGVAAGIDFGTVRIGVALSDRRRTLASPHEVYARKSPAADAQYFRRLVRDWEVTLFVVGLPVHLDGRESALSQAAREFGRWLERQTQIPTVYFDERFSTAAAEEKLHQAGLSARQRKNVRDMLAAQILLEEFFAAGGQNAPSPQGLDEK